MKTSILTKLQSLSARYEELKTILSDASTTQDLNRFRQLSKEYAQLEPTVQLFIRYHNCTKQLLEAKELLLENDIELQQLAKQEIKEAEEKKIQLEQDLLLLLLPKDPHDKNNIFLEIRAGAGGNEAAIFAGDLARMYMRYAESKKFKVEVMNESAGEHVGYKEIIMRILGEGAYSRFKFESGVHRVQRVPETEAQGRIHTSTCTIAVLPEVEEIEEIEISPADLKTDTFRASGAGGQHVQKTDSAIRI